MVRFGKQFAAVNAALIFITSSLMGASSTTFTRETRFGPISMSQDQLASLINKLESIARTANASIAPDRIDHSLRLGDDVNSIRISGEIASSTISAAPAVVTSANYEYRTTDAPISRVEMQFWDTQRSITVEGKSLEQVEALMGVAVGALSNSHALFGGSLHRIIAGAILVLIGVFLPSLTFLSSGRSVKWALSIVGPALALSVMLLPWDRWFPGTAIYSGEASFIVRHAAIICFLGVVVRIITSCLVLFLGPRLRRSR